MNIQEMLVLFSKEGIRPDIYTVGKDRDDTHCIVRLHNGDWLVYYSERGKRRDEMIFASEECGVKELVDRVLEEPNVRLPPA